MYVIANGMIATGLTKAPGKLLITEEHVHVLKEDEVNPLEVLILGPLVTWLLSLAGRRERTSQPPAFLSEREASTLRAGHLRSIRNLEPIECFPISKSLDVERTSGGVAFNVGVKRVRFTSYLSQKKIAGFLEARGVAVK